MKYEQLLNYLDELLLTQTEKHLNTLQFEILNGVFTGKKYTEIAKEYHRSEGYIKDEAYRLWKIISKALQEDIHKSNLKATLERIIANNYNVQIGDNINLCHNLNENKEETRDNINDKKEFKDDINDEKNLIKSIEIHAKLTTIPNLLELGLSYEKIAQVLNLPVELVLEKMKEIDS